MNGLRRTVAVGVLWWGLLGVCAWLYWPGLVGPFLLDDGANLRHLESLDTSAHYLGDVVQGNIAGPLGRPVSMLSFAATFAQGGFSPFYFKLHNLALHLLTGCVLLWFSYLVARRRELAAPPVFAVSVAAFWLTSPLFTSTVLYAVQRMTQLSTLFVLGALVAYCKSRDAWGRYHVKSAFAAALAVLLAIMAVLSKENALVVIPLILLTELGVYRPASPSARYLRGERRLIAGVFAAILVAVFAIVSGFGGGFFDYSRREFAMSERVLTEARILWDYIFGFLVPGDRGYGLFHDDIELSRSLLDPGSTLIAVAGVTLLAAWSGWQILSGRRNLVAYGVAFFLAGHLLESTIFPLELYFEHRNYLPAAGLAIAFVSSLEAIGRNVHALATPARLALVGSVIVAAINLGVQSTWWSNKYLLVIRNIEEHPRSQRANVNMAIVLAESGFPEQAVKFSDVAAELGGISEPARVLRRLGLYCTAKSKAPEHIIESLGVNVGQLNDEASNEALKIVAEHIVDGNCDSTSSRGLADLMYDRMSRGLYMTPTVAASMAKIENALGRFDHALAYAEFLVARNPTDAKGSMMSVYFSWILGNDEKLRVSLTRLSALDCDGKLRNEDADTYWQFVEAAKERIPSISEALACPRR